MDLKNASVALVDDDADVLMSLHLYLSQHFEQIRCFANPAGLLTGLAEEPANVILLDMNYRKGSHDGKEGLTTLSGLKQQWPNTEVIMMTAYSELPLAVEAIKKGAYDFLEKPWRNEKLLITIHNALRQQESRSQVQQLEARERALLSEDALTMPFIGRCTAMLALKEQMMQVANTQASVSIIGEHGTGKELVSRLLHQHSAQQERSWVKWSPADGNEEKQWIALFGDSESTIGKWQLAGKGTLLLDEPQHLVPKLQEKLISLLEEAKRKGQSRPRLTSSSREPLDSSALLPALYYELCTVELIIPPLRERGEDLQDLLEYFLQYYAETYRKPLPAYEDGLLDKLAHHNWPGNVRELRHAAERCIVLNQGDSIKATELIPGTTKGSMVRPGQKVAEMEKGHIAHTLKKHEGNVSRASKELGLTRAALYRRIAKYGLR